MILKNVNSNEEMGRLAADIFTDAIRAKPDIVLGLATGSTPLTLYGELVRRYGEGKVDFSEVRTVNLDEYVGLSGSHNQSYRYFMDENLFKYINIDLGDTNLPDGLAENLAAECERYNEVIDGLGGIDLQLLGIGLNGHLGFNEPSDAFSLRTQVTSLTESTINANSRFFSNPSEVPRLAITMGIQDIMRAKKIILVADAKKKSIVEKAMNGEITPQVPASILQSHADVTIVLSEE